MANRIPYAVRGVGSRAHRDPFALRLLTEKSSETVTAIDREESPGDRYGYGQEREGVRILRRAGP